MLNVLRTFANRVLEYERKFVLQDFMRLGKVTNFRSYSICETPDSIKFLFHFVVLLL